jgi:hypothetical protein
MSQDEPLRKYRQKLRGAYSLTRFKQGKDESWLLVKKDDGEAEVNQDILETQPESALTGRSLEEVATAGEVLAKEFCFH